MPDDVYLPNDVDFVDAAWEIFGPLLQNFAGVLGQA
jgi:hypothetical protein